MVSQSFVNDLPFPILGFAARSGTGKTTLLKQLIPLLKKNNHRLGLIKHTHHAITFDNHGCSKRIFEKGIDVIGTSPNISMAEYHYDGHDALRDGIEAYRTLPIDLLLIEGFKNKSFPKLELHRSILEQPLLAQHDDTIIAIASDTPQALHTSLPTLNICDPIQITQWIESSILAHHKR